MPCYDSRSNDPDYICEDVVKRCNAATRAACELATALGGSKFGGVVFDSLSKPTQQWVREHEKLDKKRRT